MFLYMFGTSHRTQRTKPYPEDTTLEIRLCFCIQKKLTYAASNGIQIFVFCVTPIRLDSFRVTYAYRLCPPKINYITLVREKPPAVSDVWIVVCASGKNGLFVCMCGNGELLYVLFILYAMAARTGQPP